jgi:hypothetical protein
MARAEFRFSSTEVIGLRGGIMITKGRTDGSRQFLIPMILNPAIFTSAILNLPRGRYKLDCVADHER